MGGMLRAAIATITFAILLGTALHAQPAGPIVILAPHPDDETLGAGGLIATRAGEGRRVVVVVVTDGRALLRRFGIDANPSEVEVAAMRKDEPRRSVNILTHGKGEIVFMDIPNESLVAQRDVATQRMTTLLAELRPAELYVTSPFESHAEHVATNEIARTACAASRACGAVFEFIVTLKSGTDLSQLPRRQTSVDVSAHRELEHLALQQFRSHLDVISPKLPTPFEQHQYERYLTPLEPFLIDETRPR